MRRFLTAAAVSCATAMAWGAQIQPAAAAAPVANADFLTIFEDCSSTPAPSCGPGLGGVVDVVANDIITPGPTTLTVQTPPASGVAEVIGPFDPVLGQRVIRYIPNPNFFGADPFDYQVCDSDGQCAVARVNVTVTPVNDPPVCADRAASAEIGKATTVAVPCTDVDGAGDVVTAVIVNWPTGLGAQPTPQGVNVTFTPTATGTFGFTFRAQDAAGALSAAPATVTVTVRTPATASEQILALIDKTLMFVDRPALAPALKAQLQVVVDALLRRNTRVACSALDVYIGAVRAAPASVLTAAEKAELIADARNVKVVAGCP